ncbi:hypothetical protein EF906_07455 [Streptomyces sp. WAC08241]|nr:hypothetical protein EF906_07455 [Streptomyces sp. WAC08241]
MLWRTCRILCTERGTALWTNSYRSPHHPCDLRLSHPPAVGEKKFSSRAKIRTNGPHPESSFLHR